MLAVLLTGDKGHSDGTTAGGPHRLPRGLPTCSRRLPGQDRGCGWFSGAKRHHTVDPGTQPCPPLPLPMAPALLVRAGVGAFSTSTVAAYCNHLGGLKIYLGGASHTPSVAFNKPKVLVRASGFVLISPGDSNVQPRLRPR